jgi:predicted dehydrogenase
MTMEPLRVGIVGAGWMGVVHAGGWVENAPRAEIVAVADVSAARARDLADRFAPGARAYDDLGDLLADPGVQAADICLPHHLHADAILRSARAGKAILCEKPLCTSLDEARTIRAAIAESRVPFMPAHNQLFQPSLIDARRLLDEGILGRRFIVRSIEVGANRFFSTKKPPVDLAPGENSFAWRADPARAGGGEVLDTGWHGAYRLLALAEDRPVEVTAMMTNFALPEVPGEDTGLLLVRFADGTLGELATSWATGLASGYNFEVGAELGSLAGNATGLVHQLPGWTKVAERPYERVNTYHAEITHFLDVLQRGEPQVPTLDGAIRVLQLIKAAYRSAEEKRPIALPEEATEL